MINQTKKKLLKIIEIVYLIYMFYFFKTTFSIHHPLESSLTSFSDYLKHPINNGIYESKICQFGKDAMILLITYLIIRCFINFPKLINIMIISITMIVSLLNMNAVLYLLPFVIVEIFFAFN